ncbi:MAG: glucosaminidase domain-containing protein [Candidatus Symbiothrix sp.]|jgi:LysM repeat protein|nr:glucosaminidase domain-containing protein [Candidatus Symbiothrix sp.]
MMTSHAQNKQGYYLEYIDQYSSIAVKNMEKHGIPASITLAQALLESGAGKSLLAKEANNHFGIKCHTDWTGERTYQKDDKPNDCFRKYKEAKESYEDHAKFLKERKRYAVFFTYDIKDYSAWAKGLQSNGYATDKAYANKLIKIIEDYELYKFDSKSSLPVNSAVNNVSKAQPEQRQFYVIYGLHYVLAEKNDSFEKIAFDIGLQKKDIIKYNEVPEDFPLHEGDVVYVEKKKKKADKPNFEHEVKIGESMHSISQWYGIQLKSLYSMNKKETDYVPTEGDILGLR